MAGDPSIRGLTGALETGLAGVKRGQVIGLIGQTGRATGPNLHWGFNWFQVKLDPSLSTPTPEPPRS